MQWMAWTPITAWFFITIGLMIMGMTIWQLVSPTVPRKGFLPIITTRGDRLFIGLLGGVYILLIWIGLVQLNLWYALALAILFLVVVMRWG